MTTEKLVDISGSQYVRAVTLVESDGTAYAAGGLAAPYTTQQKVTGSAVVLPTKVLKNGVVITASLSNSGSIMVGPSGVTATDDGTGNGYKLLPGQSVGIGAANLNQIYIIGVSGYAATDFIYVVGN